MPTASSGPPLVVAPATRADTDAIVRLVLASGLPLEGLAAHLTSIPNLTFVIRADDGSLRACAVVERHGRHGLLRSVTVRAGEQSRGLGAELVSETLRASANDGIDTVYLLTETAAPFFARLGFLPLNRLAAPDEIRESGEFASVCPASAQLMARTAAGPPTGPSVRPAQAADIASITRIYNQGIEDRLGTFETRLRAPEDVRRWFDGRHPVVVVTDQSGAVAAFAATFDYRPRACYAGIAEFSVYAQRTGRGRGLGRRAMEALIAASERAGFWKLISRVFVENTPSRRLMKNLGFREVGIYEKHGQLDGRWRDVVVVERLLDGAGR